MGLLNQKLRNHQPLLWVVLVCVITSCNTSTDPKETCDFPPGNRDFTWAVDTVALWPSTVGGVWAFADDDAYVMGSIVPKENPQTLYLALRWDGKVWSKDVYIEDYSEINHYSTDVTGDDFYMVSVGYWDKSDEKAGLAEFDNRTKEWKGFQYNTKGSLRSVWTDGEGFFIAVGDNGMVYTKDGYEAEWVYSKAPTEFNLTGISGVSKNEMFIKGHYYSEINESFQEYWRFSGSEWIKLYESKSPETTPLNFTIEGGNSYDIAAYRCFQTDSLELYLIGWESFLAKSEGQSLNFDIKNLSSLGLPLRSDQRTGLSVDLFNPNDVWIYGTRYNFYHWNGVDFKRIYIPGLPNDNSRFGSQGSMVKTKSGKVFFPTEISSQVYVVAQGVSK